MHSKSNSPSCANGEPFKHSHRIKDCLTRTQDRSPDVSSRGLTSKGIEELRWKRSL